MKKKRFVLIILAALLALILICVVFFSKSSEKNEETSATEETTLSTQQTTQPAEVEPALVFEDSLFTFTGGQFRERFNETLPDGYVFAERIVNNPDRSNNLQLDIMNDAGGNTGIAILLNVTDPEQAFCQMALTAGENDDADDFAALANWFVTTFLVGLSEEDQMKTWESYVELFNSGADDYRLMSVDDHTAMMLRETEATGNQYYILVTVG